jgi:hypothetical protein
MGAAEPLAKALPMTPDDVATLIRTAPTPQIKAACFMAWATASRFGEIRPLTGKNFRRVGREQLLCVWTTTKGNPEGKPRIDHYCDFRAPAWFRKHLREHPNNPFKCGRRLRTHLRSVLPKATDVADWNDKKPPNVTLKSHYTGHSLKRGAAAMLWLDAAKKLIPPAEVLRLLKHKNVESALEYAPDPHIVTQVFSTATANARLTAAIAM